MTKYKKVMLKDYQILCPALKELSWILFTSPLTTHSVASQLYDTMVLLEKRVVHKCENVRYYWIFATPMQYAPVRVQDQHFPSAINESMWVHEKGLVSWSVWQLTHRYCVQNQIDNQSWEQWWIKDRDWTSLN